MPADEERRQRLHDSIRQIVTTRERTPRDPNWAAAWRRTLLRYVDQLQRRPQEPGAPPPAGDGPKAG